MCIAVLRLGVAAVGQTAVDGALAGRVVFSSGQPVARAHIVLRAVDVDADGGLIAGISHAERVVEAGSGGSFLALRLPAGEYEVEATTGTRLLGRERVTVELGIVSEVTLREGLSIPVSVTPLKPMSQNRDVGHSQKQVPYGNDRKKSNGKSAVQLAVGSTNVSAALLVALPLEERRWEDASLLSSETHDVSGEPADSTPEDGGAAVADEGSRSNAGVLLSFRGIAPTQNASLLDGVSGDRGFRGGARGEGGLRSQSSFSQGSVRAFRVSPHSYSAQYGGGAGGLLTAASRSGGDALHGGGFYTVRESAWAAANPFSVVTHYKDGVIVNSLVKPRDSLQSVGGRIGGPVGGRRVFGFASIDEQFRGFPAVSSPSLATFYALSATQVALLGNRGVTAAATRAALNYLDSLTGEVPRSANRGLEFVRFDVRASARDNVTASYSHSRLDSPAGSGRGASAAVVARGTASLGDSTVRGDAATVRWLHTFSPKLNNEVRGQFATDLEFEQPRAPLAQEAGIGPGGFAPQVSIQGEFLYGTPASLGRNAYPDEQRVQAADVLQWAPGHHLFTMGADWSRVHDRIDSLADTDGSFRYDSGATAGRAGGLVDWITDFTFNVRANPNGGCPSINATNHFFCFRSFTQSFGQQQVEFTTHDFAGFAQDLWRLRAGLTVEMGARYEYTLLPLPQQPNVALDAAFRATGATSVFPEDRNNAGPRVAVAWSPRQGHWGTARVGYGVYFGRLPGSRVRAALLDTALPSSATRIHITPTTVTACPQVANQGFGYPCAYVSAPPAAVAATTSADLFAHNFRLPAVQQAELTLEREFGAGLSVRGTYSMAIATQLP
ncbi:MAG: TonB-dependent receptor, partial [Acidobacteriota bacterium]|nr:TonB-dependent receptor [Acidobacteriota bacterium]